MTGYALYVFGPEGDVEGFVELECLSDAEAARVAFGAASPFGHELWNGATFLGWFAAGDRAEPAD